MEGAMHIFIVYTRGSGPFSFFADSFRDKKIAKGNESLNNVKLITQTTNLKLIVI